jgi:hypothetical protein
MENTSQKRAIKNYRDRLVERGLARFEILGLEGDRDLLRSLARRLSEKGPDAARLRTVLNQTIATDTAKKGGILAALRRSPLVGVELDLTRPVDHGRKVEL